MGYSLLIGIEMNTRCRQRVWHGQHVAHGLKHEFDVPPRERNKNKPAAFRIGLDKSLMSIPAVIYGKYGVRQSSLC